MTPQLAPLNVGMKFPPADLLRGSSPEMRVGWRPNQCFPPEDVIQTDCTQPTWFYVLLGVAVIAGLKGGR